jgi:polyferredoxin
LVLHYLDVVVLLGALGLASYLVLKRRSRRGIIGLSLFSLLYFGFYRKGCVCTIGSVQNVALALGDPGYALSLPILIFFVAPLVTTLFFGRSFCAAVCPHGALQDLVLLKPVTLPRWLDQALGVLPFIFLGAGVLFAATGSAFLICRLDPFVPIFRLSGSFTLLMLGAVFVLAGMFIGRPYCRFFCPYGALLRLAGAISKWRVRVTPDLCTQCRLCEPACPFGAMREPALAALQPQELRRERLRFLALVALLPVWILVAGWLGSRFALASSSLHPEVALAELYLEPTSTNAVATLAMPETLARRRAERTAEALLPAALAARRRLQIGGWAFGGFIGLVAGLKLVGFSFWRRQTDYEPDRATCVACARCFAFCPQERLRLGLAPAEPVPRPTAPLREPHALTPSVTSAGGEGVGRTGAGDAGMCVASQTDPKGTRPASVGGLAGPGPA